MPTKNPLISEEGTCAKNIRCLVADRSDMAGDDYVVETAGLVFDYDADKIDVRRSVFSKPQDHRIARPLVCARRSSRF